MSTTVVGASRAQVLAQARGSEDAHNTSTKRKHKQNKRFCVSCACAYAYVKWEFAAVKAHANARNIVGQQDATLLGPTCCERLHTKLCVVACCCDLLEVVGWSLKVVKLHPTTSNKSQQHATTHNMVCKRSQHVGPNNVASVCTGLKHAHYLMSESPPSCFTEKVWNQKKGNYEICARLCAYTCVEGVLAFAMLMLMPVLMLHKKS